MNKLIKSTSDWIRLNYVFRIEYFKDNDNMKKTKDNIWKELYWFGKPVKFWCSTYGIYEFWKFIFFSKNQINFDNKYGINRYYLHENNAKYKYLPNPYIWHYKKLDKYSKNIWTDDIKLKYQKDFLEENFTFISGILQEHAKKIELHPENNFSLNKGSWKRLSIFGIQGWNKLDHRLEKLIKNNFDISTSHGLVFFSQTEPLTEIKGHFGSSNIRLRIHLGIDIPIETGLVVKGETLHWKEGKVLIFDDSYFHSSYNNSNTKRTVLIIDIYNPYLNSEEKKILNYSIMKNLGKL